MADDNKNPLDVLEELLKQSDVGKSASKSGAGSGSNAAGLTDEEIEAKPDEKTEQELAQELEQRRQEYEQKEKERKIVDEQKVVEQREAITSIKDSQEYKARVQQDSDKKIEIENKVTASDGFEIDQLDHTKV